MQAWVKGYCLICNELTVKFQGSRCRQCTYRRISLMKKNINNENIIRKMKIDRILDKYKCTDVYKIPENPKYWGECPHCRLRPLVWIFDNGESTACGCGEDDYNHFSIRSESIRSVISRTNTTIGYDSFKLASNWNDWVRTGEITESAGTLKSRGAW